MFNNKIENKNDDIFKPKKAQKTFVRFACKSESNKEAIDKTRQKQPQINYTTANKIPIE